jgi:hypothetical protein
MFFSVSFHNSHETGDGLLCYRGWGGTRFLYSFACFSEDLLDPRRGESCQQLCRRCPILERMDLPTWNMNKISCRSSNRLFSDLESELPFQDIELLFLEMVNMRRWAVAWAYADFQCKGAPSRFFAGSKKSKPITHHPVRLTFSSRYIDNFIGHLSHLSTEMDCGKTFYRMRQR